MGALLFFIGLFGLAVLAFVSIVEFLAKHARAAHPRHLSARKAPAPEITLRPRRLEQPPPFGLFGSGVRRRNAVAEINNRLVDTRDVAALTPDEVERILQRHRVTTADVRRELAGVYRDYLGFLFEKGHLTEADAGALQDLRRSCQLHRVHCHAPHREVYRQAVVRALSAGDVERAQVEDLRRAAAVLRIFPAEAERILAAAAEASILRRAEAIAASGAFSPDDEERLNLLAARLGARLQLPDSIEAGLQQARFYWQLQQRQLPVVDPEIKLQRGELCHHRARVNWYEPRTVTSGVRYGGLTGRLQLVEGIFLRLGELRGMPIARDEMKLVDSGEVFLTTKRILFKGERRSSTIRFNRVLDLEVFSNGVRIQKDAGPNPFLEIVEGDTKAFTLIAVQMLAAS